MDSKSIGDSQRRFESYGLRLLRLLFDLALRVRAGELLKCSVAFSSKHFISGEQCSE